MSSTPALENKLCKEGPTGLSGVSYAMLNTDAIGWPYFPGAFLESTIPSNLVGMLLLAFN